MLFPMAQEINITSIKDERVEEARTLQTAKGRLAAKKFLAEGEEQIQWTLGSPCRLQHIFAHDKQQAHPFVQKLRKEKVPVYFVSDGISKKITDTSYLVPFVGVVNFPESASAKSDDLIVVLDGVSDFGNIGTILRTAAAFGIREIASTDETQDFFYRKTIDASRGSVFSCRFRRYPSGIETIRQLKEQGYQIAVTTPHASVMQSFAKIEQKPIAIVFGNETNGASQEILENADIKIQIPMSGSMESLNVGVAAGISLYELKIKWVLTMLIKKIQESLGRHLSCASKWARLVFDSKLKEVSPFSANQAIMMMILKCDGTSDEQKLAQDAGVLEAKSEIAPLVEQGIFLQKGSILSLSEKGEEVIAKIWPVHELSEQIVFNDLSDEEKDTFVAIIEKIYKNCEKVIPFS